MAHNESQNYTFGQNFYNFFSIERQSGGGQTQAPPLNQRYSYDWSVCNSWVLTVTYCWSTV